MSSTPWSLPAPKMHLDLPASSAAITLLCFLESLSQLWRKCQSHSMFVHPTESCCTMNVLWEKTNHSTFGPFDYNFQADIYEITTTTSQPFRLDFSSSVFAACSCSMRFCCWRDFWIHLMNDTPVECIFCIHRITVCVTLTNYIRRKFAQPERKALTWHNLVKNNLLEEPSQPTESYKVFCLERAENQFLKSC